MVQRLVGVEYVNMICSRWVVGAVSLENKTIKRKSIPELYIKRESKFVLFVACDILGKRRRRRTNMKERKKKRSKTKQRGKYNKYHK